MRCTEKAASIVQHIYSAPAVLTFKQQISDHRMHMAVQKICSNLMRCLLPSFTRSFMCTPITRNLVLILAMFQCFSFFLSSFFLSFFLLQLHCFHFSIVAFSIAAQFHFTEPVHFSEVGLHPPCHYSHNGKGDLLKTATLIVQFDFLRSCVSLVRCVFGVL